MEFSKDLGGSSFCWNDNPRGGIWRFRPSPESEWYHYRCFLGQEPDEFRISSILKKCMSSDKIASLESSKSLFKHSRFLFGTVLPICPVEATCHNRLADPEGGRMFIERPYKPFTDPEGPMYTITTYDHLLGRDFSLKIVL